MALAWYGFHRELVIFLTCTQLCQCNAIICWNWHWVVFFFFQVQAWTGLSRERPDSPLCSQCWFMWCQVFIWDESKEKHTAFLSGPAQEKCGKQYCVIADYLIDWQVEDLKGLFAYDVTWNQEIFFLWTFLFNLMLELQLLSMVESIYLVVHFSGLCQHQPLGVRTDLSN